MGSLGVDRDVLLKDGMTPVKTQVSKETKQCEEDTTKKGRKQTMDPVRPDLRNVLSRSYGGINLDKRRARAARFVSKS